MTGLITPRDGLDPAVLAEARAHPPLLDDASRWCTRQSAADAMDVGIRTVDRYLRNRQLTGFRGPVPEGGIGVRVWSDDVLHWAENQPIEVVE